MTKIRSIFRKAGKIFAIKWVKTIYFNAKFLPAKLAIRLPVVIRKNVKFVSLKGSIEILSRNICFGMISFGGGSVNIFDDRSNRTLIELNGKLIFRGIASFGRGSVVSVGPDACLDIGDHFSITAASKIVCFDHIIFKRNCLLSWDILVIDSDFHQTIDPYTKKINPVTSKPITIGENCWIGNRAMILKGVTIPDNIIVGAMSLMNKDYSDISSNSLLAGVPAILKGTNICLYRD